MKKRGNSKGAKKGPNTKESEEFGGKKCSTRRHRGAEKKLNAEDAENAEERTREEERGREEKGKKGGDGLSDSRALGGNASCAMRVVVVEDVGSESRPTRDVVKPGKARA